MVISLLMGSPSSSAAHQKATVFGTPTATLRTGAGVEHALKAILKEGDPVSVEQATGEWYLVIAADGQKGYVHRNLVKLAAEVVAQPAPVKINPAAAKAPSKNVARVAVSAAGAVATTTHEPAKPPLAPAPVTRGEQPKAAEAKSQSILQMIEGHESEVKRGLIIAATAFVLGWLCGVGFYARRERKSRHKLRF